MYLLHLGIKISQPVLENSMDPVLVTWAIHDAASVQLQGLDMISYPTTRRNIDTVWLSIITVVEFEKKNDWQL